MKEQFSIFIFYRSLKPSQDIDPDLDLNLSIEW